MHELILNLQDQEVAFYDQQWNIIVYSLFFTKDRDRGDGLFYAIHNKEVAVYYYNDKHRFRLSA